jgi:hypothetical protein
LQSGWALITVFAVPSKDGDTKWLDNAILEAWLTADNPKTFVMPAYPHSYMVAAFPDTSPPAAVSIRIHQEWALLAYLVWDHATASAEGNSKNNQANRLANYASALLAANNVTGPAALSNIWGWGFIESVWCHPFLTRLRPPSAKTMQELGGKWTVFSDAHEDSLPEYMRGVPCVEVVLPNRGVPRFPHILNVLEDLNAAAAATMENGLDLNLLPEENDQGAPLVDPLLDFGEPDDDDNPFFGVSPVAASTSHKRRRLDHSSFPGEGSQEHPISTLSSAPTPAAPYDPLALDASTSVLAAVVKHWTLPFQLVGQSPIIRQAPSSPQMSAALRTAIRQSLLTSPIDYNRKAVAI